MTTFITGDIFINTPLKQTLRAWEPFWDCVDILFEFQNSDVDEEHTEWRTLWVAGIALLRTIGHVLIKSDSKVSPKHRIAIETLWMDWKNDAENNNIFWSFIEEERNNLLKTYEFGASLMKGDEGFYVGYSNGEDAFRLFREAVYWWRYQLNRLEADIL